MIIVIMLAKTTITVTPVPPPPANYPKHDKEKVLGNCIPFADCINKTKNIPIENPRGTDVVMLMYKLMEYADNYLKALVSLWQYYRDFPFSDPDGYIANIPAANNNSVLFIFKQ